MNFRFACIYLLFSLLLPVSAQKEKNEIPEEIVKAFQTPDKVVLYSLEPLELPTENDEKLYRYKVLGHAELDAKQSVVAVEEFKQAVAGWDGVTAMCFDPRHALRVTSNQHIYDLLLCYECHQLLIYRDSEAVIGLGAHGSSRILRELLTELKVPLSTSEETDEEKSAKKKKAEAAENRWYQAMPESIKPLWTSGESKNNILGEVSPSFRAAIAKEFPDKMQRISALYTWFGSGEGPWSAYRGYEDDPEHLLLELETADLIAAAQGDHLTEQQIEGAARLFASFDFSRDRPNDLKILPDDLKKELLDHCLKSPEEYKKSRARSAFR